MTREERRQHLKALEGDLQAELKEAEADLNHLSGPYTRAARRVSTLREQIDKLRTAANWFGTQNDPEPVG